QTWLLGGDGGSRCHSKRAGNGGSVFAKRALLELRDRCHQRSRANRVSNFGVLSVMWSGALGATPGTSGGNPMTQRRNRRSNSRVSPSHSVVTALAQGGKRRAAGRAGYAQR